jgi:hypothetical protein
LDNIPNRQSLQAFVHQLAGVSVEQNSIGHTQIIISQDFKRVPEGLIINAFKYLFSENICSVKTNA